MRRDTQIGIILGIVILVIIGVFLSTRATDNEAVLPDLVLSEEVRQKTEVKEIDINSIFEESKDAEPEETPSSEYSTKEALITEELVESAQPEKQPEITLVEKPKEDTSLEGKWEGVAEEIVEEPEITEVEPVEDPQTTSYAASTEAIYYKVQSNDNLFKIARKHYGDGQKWIKIFEANSDSMPDSNSLYVGQKLLIPDVTVEKEEDETVLTPVSGRLDNKRSFNVDTHTVEPGDTLYRLAEEYYDDPTVWIKIYEANEDTIEDKGLLKEGQILIIPKL